MFKMILDYYKQANYEFLNHKDMQEWLDKIIKESILEMIHLNF